MAAISVTAANCLQVTGINEWGTAAATITAGQLVYESSSLTFALAKADAASTDDVYGIALNNASTSRPLCVQKTGTITIGGTVVQGVVYCLDDAVAGAIIPWADLTADDTDYLTIIGPGTSATVIDVELKTTSVVLPTP